MTEAAPGARRNTRQGAAVEETMRQAEGFRTAQEVFAEVTAQGHRVGLTTVYRHLNLLAEQGRADVVHNADGEARFRLCGQHDQPEHHHHVVCRICGRSVEVSGPEVEQWAERVATAAGYTDVTHTLEVFGVCPQHTSNTKTGRPR
jgi:Fur family transcriptional regulator, ferric uptake regulator